LENSSASRSDAWPNSSQDQNIDRGIEWAIEAGVKYMTIAIAKMLSIVCIEVRHLNIMRLERIAGDIGDLYKIEPPLFQK
jgi:hypothetical protein